MTKKILLVEDEPLAQARIASIIQKERPDWTIQEAVQSVSELKQVLAGLLQFDLILCDIHLADGLSFTAFQNREITVPIIFITAYDEYALQSFEHNCIDYVLKPIQEDRLLKAFDKAGKFVISGEPNPFPPSFFEKFIEHYAPKAYKKRFLTKLGNKLVFVNVEEVAYFFADGGVTFLVETGTSQKFVVDYSLNELESELLDPQKFYRINRSMIINLDNLLEMKPYHNGRLVLSLKARSEDAIVVARERVNEFKSWINQ
ncbi:LytTR family DNA-binding domain-containing protein [Algoriphagus confluentis]|uniref:LytTR family DNA-binding domain-containing protein n=1 Tax=Algoriphagus confluentis TaxID=1697556 RepID=A0ABQ6PPF4_9BACT|nr:LytTR family DNA-binding domain-containing protein [Algoriphagus confluentis]